RRSSSRYQVWAEELPIALQQGPPRLRRRLSECAVVVCRSTICGELRTVSYLCEKCLYLVVSAMGSTSQRFDAMKVLFITGFAPIACDREASRQLYIDSLGLSLKEESDGYLHTEALEGANSFGLWPLSQAAQSCFGSNSWPKDLPIPQA